MRITAELLEQVQQYQGRTNPLQERELVLRGLGIWQLENLGAASNTVPWDALDLSQNRLIQIHVAEQFPRNWQQRLQSLYLMHNAITQFFTTSPTRTLSTLTTLLLCYNSIDSFRTIGQIAQACPNLEFLSLRGNPVTSQHNYRLFTITAFRTQPSPPPVTTNNKDKKKIKSTPAPRNDNFRILDFQRIRTVERKAAAHWFKSTLAMEARKILTEIHWTDNNNNNNNTATNDENVVEVDTTTTTFVPGESLETRITTEDVPLKNNNWNPEQKELLRQLLEQANSEAEIRDISWHILQQGMTPEQYRKRKLGSDHVEEEKEDNQKNKRIKVPSENQVSE